VALIATHLSPGFINIHRMLEFKPFLLVGNLVGLTASLGENYVTGIAAMRDGLAVIAGMIALVAAHTALEIEMADVVRVDIPAHFHMRKYIQ
jgi:hypothetical protein